MAKPSSPPRQQAVEDFNACTSTSNVSRRAPKKRETTFREWAVNNQIGVSLTILLTLFAAHNLYPTVRSFTTPFFQLSYYQPETGLYSTGWDDAYYVFSTILALTAIRAMFIDWIFRPLARKAGLKKKASIRFAEQAWLFVYDLSVWSFGMYLWKNSNYWGDFKAIWYDWPKRELGMAKKWYILTQLSFWFQQIFVINIEAPRKDHYQMLTHHLITSTLVASAYIYRFYNVSNVVLCLMDVVDFLLPTAKIFKYFGYENLCNAAFVVFLITWLVARQILFPMLCWSIYKNVPDVMAYGCYSGTTAEMLTTNGYPDRFAHLFAPYFNIDGPICMNRTVKWIFLSFLLSLLVLNLLWFVMIVKIAIGFIRSGSTEDSRSDGEDEEDEESETEGPLRSKESSPVVSADGTGSDHAAPRISPTSSVRSRRGVLGDQADRKALLGRIGCEKPTNQ